MRTSVGRVSDDSTIDTESTDGAESVDDLATSDEPAQGDRWRISVALIVVASIIALVTTVNTWLERQLLDTDEWVELSDAMLANDDVRNALAVFIVDELYESVDLGAALDDRLPDELDPLAGLVAGVLREPLTGGVDRLLASDSVRAVWHQVNTTGHATAVALLREEDVAGVSTSGGEIAIELAPVIRQVGERLGFSDERLAEIPDDAGRIVILESDELGAAQTAVFLVETLSVVLYVLAIALFALAIYLAGSRRREAVFWVGASLVISGLLLLVGRRIGRTTAADAIADLPDRRAVASIVIDLTTDLLFQMAVAGIVYGLVIAGGAALLGSSKVAIRARWLLTPLLGGKPAIAVLTAAFALFAVLAIAPGEVFESQLRGWVFVALYVTGVVLVRRQLQREAADAPAAVAPA